MHVVLFEGPNKAGKTSIMQAFNAYNKYKFVCIDRAFISQFVYENIRNGQHNIDGIHPEHILEFMDMCGIISALGTSISLVFVTAAPDILDDRVTNTDGDSPPYEASCFTTVIKCVQQICNLHVIDIDGGEFTAEENVNKLTLELDQHIRNLGR